jgi:hypothetical protein
MIKNIFLVFILMALACFSLFGEKKADWTGVKTWYLSYSYEVNETREQPFDDYGNVMCSKVLFHASGTITLTPPSPNEEDFGAWEGTGTSSGNLHVENLLKGSDGKTNKGAGNIVQDGSGQMSDSSATLEIDMDKMTYDLQVRTGKMAAETTVDFSVLPAVGIKKEGMSVETTLDSYMLDKLREIHKPLPTSGTEITGSETVLFYPADVKGAIGGNKGTFSWKISSIPFKNTRVEIVRLVQKDGPANAAPFQFVFVDGKLELEAEARVAPKGDAGDLAWDAPDMGNIKPVVTKKNDGTGTVTVSIVYAGLPERNDGFGKKKLAARLNERSSEKPFEVFFKLYGTDNPHNTGNANPKWPNWYFYWKQGAVPGLEEFIYTDDPEMGGGYNRDDKKLYVALTSPDIIYGFTATFESYAVAPNKPHIFVLERLTVKGIDALAAIVKHEKRHQELFTLCDNGAVDYDNDGVPDKVEAAKPAGGVPGLWLDREQARTYYTFNYEFFFGEQEKNGASQDDEQKKSLTHQLDFFADNEFLAIIAEKNKESDKSRDWAFPGSQTK